MEPRFKLTRVVIRHSNFCLLCASQNWCNRAEPSDCQDIIAKLESYRTIGIRELQELAELIVDVTYFGDGLERDDYIRDVMSHLSEITVSYFD